MTAAVRAKSRKPEQLLFTVGRNESGGCLLPHDGYTAKRMRERGYGMGNILLATLSKPRNPGFWRLAHRVGQLVEKNIDEFSGMEAHAVLKRLQIEGGIACDEVPAFLDIMGQKIKLNQRIPRSLSYANMEDGEFRDVMRQFCEFIASEYWPGLTAEQVEEMAEAMPEAA